jgi:hypothetical protein
MKLDKSSLFRHGLYVQTMTARDKLRQLANSLRPVKTRFELQRYGGDSDGGYLLPADFEGIKTCFSPGVDVVAGFELDIQSRKGIESHLADYSVDGPPMNLTPKSFLKKYIGVFDDDVYTTLDTWVRATDDFKSGDDMLLQMDIEGGEYLSLLGVTEELLKRFRIIVIEIHDVVNWGDPLFFKMVSTFFEKITRHFWVLHNHPNNCAGMVNLGGFWAPQVFELTLLRKDRATSLGYCEQFPHPLDRPNCPGQRDPVLPRHWFGDQPPA